MSDFITIGNNTIRKKKIDYVGILPEKEKNIFVIPGFKSEEGKKEIDEQIVKSRQIIHITIKMGSETYAIRFNTKDEAEKELQRIQKELTEESPQIRTIVDLVKEATRLKNEKKNK
jgi:hypothetical protein